MASRLKLVFAAFLLLQLLDFSRGNIVGVAYGRNFRMLNTIKNTDIEFPGKRSNPNGSSWCVASTQAQQSDLQAALDWVCGAGQADCSAIQPGQKCFVPDTLVSHASFAFNNYYKKNGATADACNFGGAGVQVFTDPSYGSCTYD